jgi:two-component system, NarL family, response regulator DevR
VNTQGFQTQPETPITVFLLDDHEVVRRGVRDLLEADPGIRVIAKLGMERRTQAAAYAARLFDDAYPGHSPAGV